MHELSVVMGVIDIAKQHAAQANATTIDEIEMDIGCLSTIQMDAFDFAWQQAVKGTLLQHSVKKINRIKGKAKCLDCETEFEIINLYDACPHCGAHLINIIDGKQMRVKTLLVT